MHYTKPQKKQFVFLLCEPNQTQKWGDEGEINYPPGTENLQDSFQPYDSMVMIRKSGELGIIVIFHSDKKQWSAFIARIKTKLYMCLISVLLKVRSSECVRKQLH